MTIVEWLAEKHALWVKRELTHFLVPREELAKLRTVVEAANVFSLVFAGHHPMCTLILDYKRCDADEASACPGEETPGPCDCGYDKLDRAIQALVEET